MLGSAAAHAAGLWVSAGTFADASTASPVGVTAVPVRARLLKPAATSVVVSADRHLPVPQASQRDVLPEPDAPKPSPALSDRGPAGVAAEHGMAEIVATAAPPQAPALTTTDEPVSAAAVLSVDGYVLRRALTVPPVPVSDITVAWPHEVPSSDRQTGIFSVFIDESGRVQRMVADGPTLFPALESAAREVFMAARFAPGEVSGLVVKSLIRVEVVFDGGKVSGTAPVPVIVSQQNL